MIDKNYNKSGIYQYCNLTKNNDFDFVVDILHYTNHNSTFGNSRNYIAQKQR